LSGPVRNLGARALLIVLSLDKDPSFPAPFLSAVTHSSSA